MPKITIRNLGPIISIEELEIKDVMVFIGPQASGKSTVAKAVYFFESLGGVLANAYVRRFVEKEAIERVLDFINLDVVKYWRVLFPELKLHNSYIRYEFRDGVYIDIYDKDVATIVDFSENIKLDISNNINTYFLNNKIFLSRTGSPAYFYTNPIGWEFVHNFSNFWSDNSKTVYIPAGRSVYAFLSENIFRSIEIDSPPQKDVIVTFFDYLSRIKSALKSQNLLTLIEEQDILYKSQSQGFLLNKLALEKINKILKGRYANENGEDRIYLQGTDNYVNLRNASSGQQESLWILMSLYFAIAELSKHRFIIEEPEAHLFPDSQKEIVELMAIFANAPLSNRLLITTHSPYILTSLNNLLYAYQVGQNDEQGVSEIIGREMWLNPDRVAAYYVDNGTVAPIMEEGLIQVEQIDAISTALNIKFDQLFHFDHE